MRLREPSSEGCVNFYSVILYFLLWFGHVIARNLICLATLHTATKCGVIDFSLQNVGHMPYGCKILKGAVCCFFSLKQLLPSRTF